MVGRRNGAPRAQRSKSVVTVEGCERSALVAGRCQRDTAREWGVRGAVRIVGMVWSTAIVISQSIAWTCRLES